MLAARAAEIYQLKQTEGNEVKIDAVKAEQKEIAGLTDEEVMSYDVF
jgi:hypothetical protein